AVESLRSVKTSVTSLRTSVGGRAAATGGGGATGAAAGGAATTVEPAAGGVAVAVASAVPQKPHSLNLAGFSSPHDGQATVSTSGVYGRRPPKRVAPRRMEFSNG